MDATPGDEAWWPIKFPEAETLDVLRNWVGPFKLPNGLQIDCYRHETLGYRVYPDWREGGVPKVQHLCTDLLELRCLLLHLASQPYTKKEFK